MVEKNNNHSNTNSSLYGTFLIKKQLNVNSVGEILFPNASEKGLFFPKF